MHRFLVAVLLVCAGCGVVARGVTNQTGQSSAFLEAQWNAAQEAVATRYLILNPIALNAGETVMQISHPEPRARKIAFEGLTIAAVPDLTPEQYFTISGFTAAAPTGEILCPAPCNVVFARSYSRFGTGVFYAHKWDFPEWRSVLEPLLIYEFETQILFRLGYDVSWR